MTGMPYITLHDAISLIIFRRFFLLFSLILLIASSSSASVIESSGLYSSRISFHNFHPFAWVCFTHFLLQIDFVQQIDCRERLDELSHHLLVLINCFFELLVLLSCQIEWPTFICWKPVFEFWFNALIESFIHQVCHLHFTNRPIISVLSTKSGWFRIRCCHHFNT